MTARKWIQKDEQAELKAELIALLQGVPREQWVATVMRKYSRKVETRVAIFQIVCAMEQSGELDQLKKGKHQ